MFTVSAGNRIYAESASEAAGDGDGGRDDARGQEELRLRHAAPAAGCCPIGRQAHDALAHARRPIRPSRPPARRAAVPEPVPGGGHAHLLREPLLLVHPEAGLARGTETTEPVRSGKNRRMLL